MHFPSTSFDLERIRASDLLAQFEFHHELGSTNDRGLELAAEPAARFPALVLAGRQTSGRGRRTNRWWSGDGALTFSLVIDADAAGIGSRDFPLISLATALGLAAVLQSLIPSADTGLKWPNDVYLSQRKVCGILVEISGQAPSRPVLGIGMNVNNSLADAPDEVRERAVSLCDTAGTPLDLTQVLLLATESVLRETSQLGLGAVDLRSRWEPFCMLRGRSVRLDMGVQRVAGLCLGIDDQGALLVQSETGVQRCLAGVVTTVR